MKKIWETGIKKISGTIAAGLRIVRNIDYRILSHTIFQIQASRDPEEALEHMTFGLKRILDYNLFAFFMKGSSKNAVMAWIEPEYYEKYMKKIFEEDSGMSTENGLIYMTIKNREENFTDFAELDIENQETRIFRLALPHLDARIYLNPGRQILPYHTVILNLLIESFRNTVSTQFEIEKLRQEASIDGLTGVSNRGDFERQIVQYVSNAKRYGKNLSLFLFDIDNFKKINDTYGHQTGDEVLKSITGTVRHNIRSCDLIARYGGEEFVVILPETSAIMAAELAERIRVKTSETIINAGGRSIVVTASFGVSYLKQDMEVHDLIRKADENLYIAKKNGKNQVVFYP
jgi:diguanylate cyclase (GGDEF)-like protein